jgi:hypothetical protein
MNHFKLFAHGTEFDVDAYRATESIGFDRIWHTGEQNYKTNGLEKILGDGTRLDIFDQDRIATEFLEQHEKVLAELANYPGVDAFILGLQYRIDLEPCLRGFCLSFSARLTYFALKTGVNPTFYVDLVPTDDWD